MLMALSKPQSPHSSKPRVIIADPKLSISSLPQNYVKRQKSYRFNIMLLGQTGVGKTTLIDTLFRVLFKDNSSQDHNSPKVEVIADVYDLHERGVHLKLGVIESRGFGDQMQIGIEESYKPIVEYIDEQFERHLEVESNSCRTEQGIDSRVHLCIYLISPVCHGLKAIDLSTMKALDKKVNLVPVIAKSDLIDKSDLNKLKMRIMNEIEANRINIYRFPINDEVTTDMNARNNSILPFAAVASNEFLLIEGKTCRARRHPWGIIEVDNEKHSDLVHLRNGIMKNMADLIERTVCLYESHRERKIVDMQMLQDKLEEQRAVHKRQEEQLIASFTNKLKCKDDELKKKERALHNTFEQMSKERIGEKMRLDGAKKQLDEDIAQLDQRRRIVFNADPKRQESEQTVKTSNKRKNLKK